MKATLRRFADSPFGVFGYLDIYGPTGWTRRFCTAEEDWLNNAPRISCIPAGVYTCNPSVWVATGVHTYEITNVPNRSRILFHYGNTEEDVEGCVLVGNDFGALSIKDEDDPALVQRLKWAIINSRKAFAEFMLLMGGSEPFQLEVKWAAPGEWRKV